MLREESFVGPEESENAVPPDDFEQVVLESLAQLPIRSVPLESLQSSVEGIPGSSEFNQPGDDFYRQPTRAETRNPTIYDGVWSVDPSEVDEFPFESSR